MSDFNKFDKFTKIVNTRVSDLLVNSFAKSDILECLCEYIHAYLESWGFEVKNVIIHEKYTKDNYNFVDIEFCILFQEVDFYVCKYEQC